MNQRFIQICLALLIVCWGGPALAHPHVFIVPAVNFSIDGDRITSLKIDWIFDEMTTMAALALPHSVKPIRSNLRSMLQSGVRPSPTRLR